MSAVVQTERKSDMTEAEFQALVEQKGALAVKVNPETGFVEELTIDAMTEFINAQVGAAVDMAYRTGYVAAVQDARRFMADEVAKYQDEKVVDVRTTGGYL